MEYVSTQEENYKKLEKLKSIREKTIQIEKLKHFIKDSLHEAEDEKQVLEKYKKEINLLLQEKMAHVEELRLIHTDINSMEGLIKQSNADRNNMLHSAKKLLDQYKPLKMELDSLRQDVGLAKSEGLDVEEEDLVNDVLGDKETSSNAHEKPVAASSESFFINEPQEKSHLVVSENGSSSHPPPMKLCGSCHQYIHRNAPICPLCKAKSRSRNPKKIRKTKVEESTQ